MQKPLEVRGNNTRKGEFVSAFVSEWLHCRTSRLLNYFA